MELMSKGRILAQEINNELGLGDNKIKEEADLILKVWHELNSNDAFELFGVINGIISNTHKMDKLLTLATQELIEKYPNFASQLEVNSSAHFYTDVLKEHHLISLVS